MGDIGSCELVEGEIVRMAPTGFAHGDCELAIGAALRAHVQKHRAGKVMSGEVGVYTSRGPDTVRGADVLYISNERFARRQSDSFLDVAPELVVEILSPYDAWSDVMRKVREYLAIGVTLVWIVDPGERSVFAYRSLTDVHEFALGDTLTAEGVLPDFTLPVADIFVD